MDGEELILERFSRKAHTHYTVYLWWWQEHADEAY